MKNKNDEEKKIITQDTVLFILLVLVSISALIMMIYFTIFIAIKL